MTEGYEPGREARRSILREVYRREKAGEPSPSLRELGELLGMHRVSAGYHVREMIGAGLLMRSDAGLFLSECARATMDLETGG